ncbi:universal stress protein [Kitasatospora sp. NPDC050463]|uniref:universal stress protein n=1 Tax=Kitasatospora sp. NPDC050463 TaxID=3155786 RepID=UPI0033E179F5
MSTETSADTDRGVDQQRRIVVGVDGSPSSLEALRWAVEQARLWDAAVDAVITWEYPTSFGWAAPEPVDSQYGAIAEKVLSESIAELADTDRPVDIHQRVLLGNAAQGLLDAARRADLLVVGSRGYGGFARALLGSASQQCVQHAPCPVVVVRHK